MGLQTSTAMQPLWILSLLVSVSASPIPLSQEQTPSWVNICNGTYLFSEDTKSWNEALDFCILFGAHIAQIDSLAENFCLLDYGHTAVLGAWYWHSANDIVSEGVWHQFDEKLLSWSPWWNTDSDGSDEPDGGKEQNCGVVALTEDKHAGKWADTLCSAPRHYICERGF